MNLINWWKRCFEKKTQDACGDPARLSRDEYLEMFRDLTVRRRAHRLALEIRNFEIELYWKRAAYFWTFIGATFAGLAAISVAKEIAPGTQQDFKVLFSCLGFVFSWGWFFVNKGSKQWQENWENHIDLLEDEYVGKLYKVVLLRKRVDALCSVDKVKEILVGPSNYSVSRINQLISFYISVIWMILLFLSLEISFENEIRWRYVAITCVSIASVISFSFLCVSSHKGHALEAMQRETKISDDGINPLS